MIAKAVVADDCDASDDIPASLEAIVVRVSNDGEPCVVSAWSAVLLLSDDTTRVRVIVIPRFHATLARSQGTCRTREHFSDFIRLRTMTTEEATESSPLLWADSLHLVDAYLPPKRHSLIVLYRHSCIY